MMGRFGVLGLAGAGLLAAGCAHGAPVTSVAPAPAVELAKDMEAARLEADVRFLADDMLEGREAGTRGFDLASHYVAQRMRSLGLKPGGDDATYMQAVPLLEYKLAGEDGGTLEVTGVKDPARFRRDDSYLVGQTSAGEDVTVEAPVVFVGFGLVSPEHGRDDYAGLDVAGKIVAMLPGAPKFLQSEERAHYSNTAQDRASEHGAVGVIVLTTPDREKVTSWARRVERARESSSVSMRWLEGNGEAHSTRPNIKALASVGPEGAEALFDGAQMSWEEISKAADSEAGDVKGFAMGVSAKISVQSTHRKVMSRNVVGVLEGSDPALRDEYVVVTAHLDHVGVHPTEEEGDDEIYNGAMDNATGVASLLETALKLSRERPRRSVLFIALTAEEKGLVGSDYFASNPTVAVGQLVADINLDMPIVTYAFDDIIAFGAERSTMFGAVDAAAKRAGISLSPDPQPEQNFFTRSDHYSFVKQGVPSIFVKTGFGNGGEVKQAEFRAHDYHQQSDEVGLVDFAQLRRFADVNAEIVAGIGNMDARPVWVKGDFFGTTFKGRMGE